MKMSLEDKLLGHFYIHPQKMMSFGLQWLQYQCSKTEKDSLWLAL